MKIIICIYVRLIYAIRALQQINRPHLGDIVTYKGEKYQLYQGVRAPYWDMVRIEGIYRITASSIHESKFQMQPLYRRFWFSFRFTYRFYMGSWYGIDVRQMSTRKSRVNVKVN